jgi:predicted MFS family arabinose efflux permease
MFEPLIIIARDPALRLVVMILFLFGAASSAIAPYQALIALELFQLPDWSWSVVMLTSALITVLSSIIAGIISDQYDNRRIASVLCVGLSILGGVIVWLGDTKTAFLVTHALLWPAAGALFGQLFAMARLAARRLGDAKRDQVVAAVRALFALAFVIALPFWSAAFAAGYSLRIIYPVITLLAVLNLTIILIFWTKDITAVFKDQQSGLSFFAALSEIASPAILLRVVLMSAILAANVLYMTMMGLLFSAAPGREFSDAALFLMGVTALEVPFMLATGKWIVRWGKVRLITFGGLFYASFLVAFVAAIPTPVIWLMIIPAAFGAALLLSVPIPYLQDLLSHRPGAGGSLPAITQMTGFALASSIFALGTAFGDYTTVALIGAGLAATAAVSLALVERRSGNWGRI